jgi:hypothetical protein
MIVSASRRSDIPAYFADWFFDRMEKGFTEVVNPFNWRQVRNVSLRPEDVDAFVFWTKNPAPMLDKLSLLKNYHYYFQFTLNPYGTDIEPRLPTKQSRVDTFKTLSDMLGAHRVLWRYDPVFLSDTIDIDFHIKSFSEYAKKLSGHTEKVIFSFMDSYRKIEKDLGTRHIKTPDGEQKIILAENFAGIARANGIGIETCAEYIELSRFGIAHGVCVDGTLLERISGKSFIFKKDKNQRPFCRCSSSVDIGAYGTCRCACIYCYARR